MLSNRRRPLRLLFAKHALGFPLWNGHDICAYNMIRALKYLGHTTALATVEPPTERAVRDLHLDWMTSIDALPDHARPELTALQARFASYFGVTEGHMVSLSEAADRFEADAVIGVGADILPYLVASTVPRVWYAGDEWVSHYASLVSTTDVSTWRNVATAVVWGMYQRAFARSLDRVWVVSREEQRQMRRWAGIRHVDALPNGVDFEYFTPRRSPVRPNSAVFWGRLDFVPNLQALQWFCDRVWPELKSRHADAEFHIIGSSAHDRAAELGRRPGVVLSSDVDDLRPIVGEYAVVVMPFRSGGGIKNKLLEAASMGKAVISTPIACYGLRGDPAIVVAASRDEWITGIDSLWSDANTRDDLGRRARQWVVREHSWQRTAADAVHRLYGVLPAVKKERDPSRRFLFAKHTLAYPRSSGHDIRTYNMMRALRQLGCEVGLATVIEPSPQALEGLRLNWITTLSGSGGSARDIQTLRTLQRRFASYFGVTTAYMRALAEAAQEFQADVVVGVGADILPYMALTDVPRVWYAGDEWVSHYSSLAKLGDVRTWAHLATAAVWGTYQRAFAGDLERIWVVSSREQRQMQRWAGNKSVDALPNGVDSEYYTPAEKVCERPRSAIFWGRLDFHPNLQALQWFCRAIWPQLTQRFPDAEFHIVGFNAGDEVRALATIPGVRLSADVEDLRPLVHEHAVVVLPFQSGGGIKNKLLEAASMGKAIVCTPIARGGLRGQPPVVTVGSAQAWVAAVSELWSDSSLRTKLGDDARAWAVSEHSWARTAQDGLTSLMRSQPDSIIDDFIHGGVTDVHPPRRP